MVTPVAASSLLLVRDTGRAIEVAMGRRPRRGTFGGAWVFPGGVIEAADHDSTLTGLSHPDGPARAAAIRETAEETGVFITDPPGMRVPDLHGAAFYEELAALGAQVAGDALVYVSNWITPQGVPRRFDTRFYVCRYDGPLESSDELSSVAWVDPRRALADHEGGAMDLILVTLKHLEYLVEFSGVDDLMADASQRGGHEPVEPILIRHADGSWQALLPGEPGYAEAQAGRA